ncbi:MAG: LacI family DNA-binding transcriptional regulator [Anaerolineaceae bacterium]|nr:LacI family DNA-binding transcriptional regulator [Anaerolineaceae bacterium]
MARINISDIAEKAGVSKTAVSFAFNYPQRLSAQTLQHILEVADEMGYSPDPIARSMLTRKTGTIGLLLPQPIQEIAQNPYFADLLSGIGEVCSHNGLSLMLIPPLMGSMRRAIDKAAVDGFLTLGLEESKTTMVVLRQRNMPFVTIDSDPIEGIPAVNVDDRQGAYLIMKHILHLGHRKIAILPIRSGKQGHYREYVGTLGARMQGYIQALEEFGMEASSRDVKIMECSNSEAGGREGFKALLSSRRQITAIVAMSDVIAFGILQEAKNRGISIPGSLSLAGFDDNQLSRFISPTLTTVSQPGVQKGELAASILIRNLAGHDERSHHMLETRLSVRESTGQVMTKKSPA